MISHQPRILVIPEGALHLAFRLLPVLHRAGFAVDVLCVRGDLVARSRYVSRVMEEDSWADVFHRAVRIMEQPDSPWRGVIVAQEQFARELLTVKHGALVPRWQPGAQEPVAREFFLSKCGLADAASAWGLPIPASVVCESNADILAFGSREGWPLMLKPPEESGGLGVTKLMSPAELLVHRDHPGFPVLAQKYVAGREGVVEMLCSSGRALAWLSSYQTRSSAGRYSPSTARRFIPIPELGPLVREVAARTRFEGFCGFDWIEDDATGRRFLTEFHPRPTAGFRFARSCGVDLSLAVRAWQEGRAGDFQPLVQPPGTLVEARFFTSDLRRCWHERDWRGLLAWLPGSGAHRDVFVDDWPVMLTLAGRKLRSWFPGGELLPGSGEMPGPLELGSKMPHAGAG